MKYSTLIACVTATVVVVVASLFVISISSSSPMPSLLRHANSSKGQRRRLTVWSDPKTVEIKDGIAQTVMALLPNIFLIGAQKAGTTAVRDGFCCSFIVDAARYGDM